MDADKSVAAITGIVAETAKYASLVAVFARSVPAPAILLTCDAMNCG
jgi:hypothetical protein